jgi:hypothetical protein
MRDRNRRCLAWIASTLVSLSGCQHLAPPPCSGERADLDSGPRTLHVRLELIRDGGERRHEVLVSVASGRITAVGLTPLGTAAFALTHDAAGLEVENRIGRHLGYQPRRVYDAIVHAYLARPDRAAAAGPDAAPVTAVVTRADDDIRVDNERCGYRARLVTVSDERA